MGKYTAAKQKNNEAWRQRNIVSVKLRARLRATSTQRRVGANASTRTKAAERRAIATEMKRKPCMDCGGVFDPVCMDFDHRPGETKILSVAAMVAWVKSTEQLLAEIAKCDVVCSNCHRLRTKNRKEAARKQLPLFKVEPKQLASKVG